MTATLNSIVNHPMLELLGWTLVHSIWQCAVVAGAMAMIMLLTRQANVRYWSACTALLTILIAAIITFCIAAPAPTKLIDHSTVPNAVLTVAPEIAPQEFQFRAALPWATIAWLVGVIVLSVRQIGGWLSLRSLRRSGQPVQDGPARAILDQLMQRLGIRDAVLLAESALVQVPSVIGWLKPIILIPCSVMTDLNPQYIESLLAHELAHIGRRDYLVNLIQIAIETLLFYHPAVWWISKQIRQERENCCDDIAVQITGDVRGYGQALLAIEQRRGAPVPALAASGASLLMRIRRLLHPQPRRAGILWPALMMAAIVIAVSACSHITKAQPTQKPDTVAISNTLVFDGELRLERTFDEMKGPWSYASAEPLTLDPGLPVRRESAPQPVYQGVSVNPVARPAGTFRGTSPATATSSGVTTTSQSVFFSEFEVDRLRTLQSRMTDAQLELLEVQRTYGPNHPKTVALQRSITDLQALYAETLERYQKQQSAIQP